MKKLLCALLTIAMLASLAACSAAPAAPAAAEPAAEPAAPAAEPAEPAAAEPEVKQVLMGINNAQPPASFVKEDGAIDGQNYEVMCLVDELLPQYEFVYEAVNGDALLLGLDSGKYAAAVGNFWYNDQRGEKYHFPKYPIGGGAEVLVLNKKYQDTIKNIDDLAASGLEITPQETSGSIHGIFTQYNEEHPDTPLNFKTGDVMAIGEHLKWVKEGRCAATPCFATEWEELKETIDPEDEMYSFPFWAAETWVLYSKDQTQLADDIDGAMKQLMDDGTLTEVSIKWFGYDIYELFE